MSKSASDILRELGAVYASAVSDLQGRAAPQEEKMIEIDEEHCQYCETPVLPGLTNCHQCGGPLVAVLSDEYHDEYPQALSNDELELWTAMNYRNPRPDYSAESMNWPTLQRAEVMSLVQFRGARVYYHLPRYGILRYLVVGGSERAIFTLSANGCEHFARDEVILPISLTPTPIMLQNFHTFTLEIEYLEVPRMDKLRIRYDVTVVPNMPEDLEKIGKRIR